MEIEQKGSTRSSKSIFESFAPTTLKHGNNSTPLWNSATTKQTPFYLMMGYEPRDIPLVFEKTNAPTTEQ